MILAVLTAMAGTVDLTIEAVGKPITQTQRLMLQSTLQRSATFYSTALGLHIPEPLPMQITVYSELPAFERIRAEKGAPPWSEGWFRRVNGVSETVLWSGSASGMRSVFLHEASHFLLSYSGRSPQWLNEGLAQVLESAQLRGNVLTVTPTPRHLRILALVGRPSVATIIRHPNSWSELPESQVGPLYVSAWALTAMLLSTPAGQRTTAAILAAHRTNPTPSSAFTAIENTYPGGLPALETAFERWAARPPRTLVLPSPIKPKPTASDAIWIRCSDGSLANRTVGCK